MSYQEKSRAKATNYQEKNHQQHFERKHVAQCKCGSLACAIIRSQCGNTFALKSLCLISWGIMGFSSEQMSLALVTEPGGCAGFRFRRFFFAILRWRARFQCLQQASRTCSYFVNG